MKMNEVEMKTETAADEMQSGLSDAGDIGESGETAKSADAIAPEADSAGPLTRREQRRKEKEAEAAQKAFRKEEESRRRQEAQEEKARQRRLAEEEKERKRHEGKLARSAVRQERRAEVKSLFHTAELVLLVVFMLLAVDQAGLYGFLFVWLFVALTAASVVLFLLGVVRAFRKKRCGIIFFASIAGIILCTAWFIFLVSSRGLGLMQG